MIRESEAFARILLVESGKPGQVYLPRYEPRHLSPRSAVSFAWRRRTSPRSTKRWRRWRCEQWLKEKDPSFGGLVRVQNKPQEFLWVHPRFEQEY